MAALLGLGQPAAAAPVQVPLRPGLIAVGTGEHPARVAVIDPLAEEVLAMHQSGLHRLADLVVSPGGVIYAAGTLDPAGEAEGIIAIDLRTGDRTEIARGFGRLEGAALTADGRVVVTTWGPRGAEVIAVDPDTGEQVVLGRGSPMRRPRGVAVGPDGAVYVAGLVDRADGEVPGIVRVGPSTGAAQVVATGDPTRRYGLHEPVDVAVGADGTIYVMDLRRPPTATQDEVRLFGITPEGEIRVLLGLRIEGIERSLADEDYLGLDVTGGILFVVDYAANSQFGGVNRYDPAGDFSSVTAESALYAPRGLSIVPGPAPQPPPGGGIPWWLGVVAIALPAAMLLGGWAAVRRR